MFERSYTKKLKKIVHIAMLRAVKIVAVEFGSFEALLLPNFVAMAAVTRARATCKKSAKNSFPKDFFAVAVSSAMHNGEQEEQVVEASCKEKILTARSTCPGSC